MQHQFAAPRARLRLFGSVVAVALGSCGGGGGGGDDGGGTPPPPPTLPTLPTLPTTTSSSATAYAVPTSTGWQVVPLLTVGDNPDGSVYAMVGKPDGLGAIAGRYTDTGELVEASTYMTIFLDHELPGNRGIARAHGTKGAFVSQWTVELDTLQTTAGRDLATRVFRFAGSDWSDETGTVVFDRLCSADLPPAGALRNTQSGNGYDGRLFLNGEETDEGSAWAFVVGGADHGDAYELPYIGKYAHENVLLHPASGDRTIAVSLDDTNPGQVYVYVGTKSNTGNAVERAGLHGGKLFGIRVTDGGPNYGSGAVPIEDAGAIDGGFELVEVTDAALGTGAVLQSTSVARGITEFARPEDGAWDVGDARTFYFATTGAPVNGQVQTPRLYRLVFDSIDAPTGGTIELALDGGSLTGTDGAAGKGFDNLTVDAAGRVFIMEDGGADAHVSKVWRFDPATSNTVQVLEADRDRVLSGGADFLATAEEHSGVIEVTDQVRGADWFDSARRYYLGTLQVHYPLEEALFEGGQIYLFASPR